MSIRTKYSLFTGSLVCAVMLCTVFLVARAQRGVLQQESDRRLDTMMETVLRVAQESVAARDELMLYSFVMVLRRQHPELAFATVLRGSRPPRTIGDEAPGLRLLTKSVPGTVDEPDEIRIRFGIVQRLVDEELAHAFRPMLMQTLGIGGAFMVVGIFAALYFAKLFSEPLRLLAKAAGAVGRGDMDFKVPETTHDELGALAHQFNSMTASLKDLMRFREDVLHTLTHELNTPLAGLKGYLELWHDGKLDGDPSKQVKSLQTMMAAVSRMEASLAGALLIFRAQERERHPERNKLVWANEVINEQIALFAAVAQSKGIALRPLGEDEIGCIYTEEDLLRQVVTNILSNAIKYTPQGGTVRAGLKNSDTDFTFWVSDTGPGIPPESIKDVFEKFDRSGAGAKSQAFGTGLGLSIAKKAVVAIGGRIWVESQVGKGATFYVSILKQLQANPAEAV